jgi:hypothetical protein
MVPFFANLTCKRAKYVSTEVSSELRRGVDGHAGRTRESEIAYASARIRPFSLASAQRTAHEIELSQPEFARAKGKNRKVRQIKDTT